MHQAHGRHGHVAASPTEHPESPGNVEECDGEVEPKRPEAFAGGPPLGGEKEQWQRDENLLGRRRETVECGRADPPGSLPAPAVTFSIRVKKQCEVQEDQPLDVVANGEPRQRCRDRPAGQEQGGGGGGEQGAGRAPSEGVGRERQQRDRDPLVHPEDTSLGSEHRYVEIEGGGHPGCEVRGGEHGLNGGAQEVIPRPELLRLQREVDGIDVEIDPIDVRHCGGEPCAECDERRARDEILHRARDSHAPLRSEGLEAAAWSRARKPAVPTVRTRGSAAMFASVSAARPRASAAGAERIAPHSRIPGCLGRCGAPRR